MNYVKDVSIVLNAQRVVYTSEAVLELCTVLTQLTNTLMAHQPALMSDIEANAEEKE